MAARRDTCHKVLTVCSFQRDGWAGARRSRGKDDILRGAGGGRGGGGRLVVARLFLPPPAVSLSFLSANQNTGDKPCRGEAPALVTGLLNGVSAGIWSQSPVGSGVRERAHARSCRLAPMLADRRGAVNSRRHSGQIWRKGISDLSIICLGMTDGRSEFFSGSSPS